MNFRHLLGCDTVDEDKVKSEALRDVLKSIHPKIQFTMEHSKEMVPLLDVVVRKEGDRIWMDLYTKPTDIKDTYFMDLRIQSIVS